MNTAVDGGSRGYQVERDEHERKLDIFLKQLDFIYDDLMEWAQYKKNKPDASEIRQEIERRWKFEQQQRIATTFYEFGRKLNEIRDEQRDHGFRWYVRFDDEHILEEDEIR